MPLLAALTLAMILAAPALARAAPAPAGAAPPRAVRALAASSGAVPATTASPGAARSTRASWGRPVRGAVARAFSYGSDPFRAGQHRGTDFAAPPGSEARAACSGVVVTARPGLVTLRCGPWRVTHLPLGSVSVDEGASVRTGRLIGSVGFSSEHRGLHLGVRRAGDRFAYVDPLTFLGGRTTAPPTVPPPRTVRVPRSGPGGAGPSGSPAPVAAAPPAPVPASLPAAALVAPPALASPPAAVVAQPAPMSPPVAGGVSPPATSLHGPSARVPASRSAAAGVSPPESRFSAPNSVPDGRVRSLPSADGDGLAPWPAWVGLVLLLVGAVGGGVRVRVHRGRARVSSPVPSAR